jgi:hypothetical protein
MSTYICGDSFGVIDPEYGPSWVDLLSQQVPVTNLCQVSASNLLIAKQVDTALASSADCIIVLFTSSTRSEIVVDNKIVPFSWHTASTTTTTLSQQQITILRDYFSEFYDLDLAIYNNECIIETVLARLKNSGKRFIFDQGGFEHSSMGATKKYFGDYDAYRSELNLWDYARTRQYRPYYHITDISVHKQIADYYQRQI